MKKLFGVFLVLSVLAASPAWCASGAPRKARAVIAPTQGNAVSGKLVFIRLEKGVRIRGKIKGLVPNGDHGFHIHEHGDCGGVSGASAGAHFDTLGHAHGEPALVTSHEGDLGNLWADSKGHARLSLRSKWLRLSGDQSILGRSIVVHSLPDDLTSQPGGNSGGRIACGLITAAIR
jgi:Cu-Zn family superoxide dismutase